jgi:hypothetical protein
MRVIVSLQVARQTITGNRGEPMAQIASRSFVAAAAARLWKAIALSV